MARLILSFSALFLSLILQVNYSFGEQCSDVNSEVCRALNATVSDMCSDNCLVNICKSYCGKCPLKCFECHEIDQPQKCNNTVTCPSSDHYCAVTQTFTNDFSEVFKLGCALNNICTSTFVQAVGKRNVDRHVRTGTHIDGGCCSKDLCNNQPPANMPPVEGIKHPTTTPFVTARSSPGCNDVDSKVCDLVSKNIPNMCSNDCLATRFCPRKCSKCFECYDCDHVSSAEQCNRTTVCQAGQECYALETLSTTTFKHGYHLGCMDQSVCAKFYTELPRQRRQGLEVSVQGVCCQSDLCNHHMVTTTTPTVTQPPTTTVQIVTNGHPLANTGNNYPSCPTHPTQCPSGYSHDQKTHSCYKAIATPMTYVNAKEYCRKQCADLADLTQDGEAPYISELVEMGVIPFNHDLSRAFTLYVDATSHTGSWKWNATGTAIPSSLIKYYHSSSQRCAVLSVPSPFSHLEHSHRFLSEVPCTYRYYVLCEIKNVN